MSSLVSKSINDLPVIARELLPEILSLKNVCFIAPMGAGKTTLIKHICMALGVPETDIQSPTYSLVNEYAGSSFKIFHFDFYRLKNIEEAYDFGLEEYFQQGALCLMEWPEIVIPLIPLPTLKITLSTDEESRIITSEIINFF